MKKDYGEVKAWLVKEGRSIKEFAEYMEVSRTHLSGVLNRRIKCSKAFDFVMWHSYEDIKKNGWG